MGNAEGSGRRTEQLFAISTIDDGYAGLAVGISHGTTGRGEADAGRSSGGSAFGLGNATALSFGHVNHSGVDNLACEVVEHEGYKLKV